MANQKYTSEELVEVLRRHLPAYKDDEAFAQGILDIGAFLVEYRAYKRRTAPPPETDTGEQRQRYLRSTEQRDEELKEIMSRYNQKRVSNCRLCGAPSESSMMCSNCGNMTR